MRTLRRFLWALPLYLRLSWRFIGGRNILIRMWDVIAMTIEASWYHANDPFFK